MFEALRGLRDAVAPESGNLGNPGNNASNENSEPDFEEFWQTRDERVANFVPASW